jgi:hypothetical protein
MGRVAGVTLDEAWPDDVVLVCFYGEIENSGWNLPANKLLFVNGQSLSVIPPETGWVQSLGFVREVPTSIFMRIDTPVLL